MFFDPDGNEIGVISLPAGTGALKNAIDWAGRPWGTNSFAGKPSGVIGGSMGAIGTAVAQQSLKGMMAFCNSPMFNSVEAYIHMREGLIVNHEPAHSFGGDQQIPPPAAPARPHIVCI